MDAKIIGYIAALFMAIGLTYFIHESVSADASNKSLVEARQFEATLQDQLRYHLAQLDVRKEAAALIAANSHLKEEMSKLQAEIDKTRQAVTQTKKDFERYVINKRQDTVGAELGDLPLSNGTLLKGVRIQKIEGTFTTVIHSQGITRLAADLLPEKLQDRFRFGLPSDNVPASTPQKEFPAVAAVDPKSVAIKSARSNLEQLQKQLPNIQAEFYKAESEANGGSSPTKRFYAKKRVDEIAQQIGAMKRRISDAEAHLAQLENSK
ncbi:hypothetical protein WJU23_06855 [Prosthecobacter sp. SYSU 5D2]|uniref:hypothetical protein n=1 Tax=Prosthecobacter sp. SYSU 5D2 TaxID=3134134 RepID=UPI0031FEBA6E